MLIGGYLQIICYGALCSYVDNRPKFSNNLKEGENPVNDRIDRIHEVK